MPDLKMDIFYVHRDRPLKLSALSVLYLASNRFGRHEISDDLLANMSKEGLKVFRSILNNSKVNNWMRELGISWKKPHHYIVMSQQNSLIEFYWMGYSGKNPDAANLFWMIDIEAEGGPLSPDFTYHTVHKEYTFYDRLETYREMTKLTGRI